MSTLLPTIEITVSLAIIIVTITIYFRHLYKYWEIRKLPFIQPKFPLGNSPTFVPRALTLGIIAKKFHDEIKQRGHKFAGIFLLTEPNLVVVDPDVIKTILVKNFNHFVDRGFYYNEKDDPISAHLFAIDGAKWRTLRTKLTPTFTSGKMKTMFGKIIECSAYMTDALADYASTQRDVDTKEFLKCFTIDVISTCAFGIDCNSFKHPDAEFLQMSKEIFKFDLPMIIKAFFISNVPEFSRRVGITGTRPEVSDFFMRVVKDAIEDRDGDPVKRNDFLQLLIDLKNSPNSECKLTTVEIAAQVFLFFVAGFDTSSTAMTFALYELAKNQEVQEKLRAEIEEVLQNHDHKITYESLKEMKYLGRVVEETLRKYPSVPTINRKCTQTYVSDDLIVEKGTPVLISTFGLHMDPDHYPDPEKFDPERFSDFNKETRHSHIYLPFGDGPRNCIGLRFGLMQSKIGIVAAIKNYRFTISPNMKPMVLDPSGFLLNSVDNIYVKVEKL